MKKTVVLSGLAAVAMGIAGYFYFFVPQPIGANNTPSLQWSADEGTGKLVLKVTTDPKQRNGIVLIPIVPRSGSILLEGRLGIEKAGSLVQVKDGESGKHAAAVADDKGVFRMEFDAEAGDHLAMLAIKQPAIAVTPEAATSPVAVTPKH